MATTVRTSQAKRGSRKPAPVRSSTALSTPGFTDNFDVVPDSPPAANLSPGQVRQEWDDRMRKACTQPGNWFRVMLSANKKAVAYRKQYLHGIYSKEFEVVARQTPEGLFGIWVRYDTGGSE